MSYEVEEIDSKDQLKLTESDVIVFNRPKYFIGSNGSGWASEYMRLRYEVPELFVVNSKITPATYTAIRLTTDQIKLYCQMSNRNDVNQVSQYRNCSHRKYEEKGAASLLRELILSQEAMAAAPEYFEQVHMTNILALAQQCEDLVKQIDSSCKASVIWDAVVIVTRVCKQTLEGLAPLFLVFKSRVREFTALDLVSE